MSFLLTLKRKANGKQYLSQLSNPDPRLAAIVAEAFRWCLEYDGIPLTEELLAEAIVEGDKYPKLTISEFIEGIYNRKLQQGLRKE